MYLLNAIRRNHTLLFVAGSSRTLLKHLTAAARTCTSWLSRRRNRRPASASLGVDWPSGVSKKSRVNSKALQAERCILTKEEVLILFAANQGIVFR